MKMLTDVIAKFERRTGVSVCYFLSFEKYPYEVRELNLFERDKGFYTIELIGIEDGRFKKVALISPTKITLGHLSLVFNDYNKFIV